MKALHSPKRKLLCPRQETISPPGLSFGEAIDALKDGKKVTRKGWNGKGMFLWLKQGVTVTSEKCSDPILRTIAERMGGFVVGLPVICMKKADDAVLTGWLASQSDMLSEDWVVLPD